jgi:hypothetical protein
MRKPEKEVDIGFLANPGRALVVYSNNPDVTDIFQVSLLPVVTCVVCFSEAYLLTAVNARGIPVPGATSRSGMQTTPSPAPSTSPNLIITETQSRWRNAASARDENVLKL